MDGLVCTLVGGLVGDVDLETKIESFVVLLCIPTSSLFWKFR